MAKGKIKVNFKMPTPSAADRMYAKHQEIRKAAGLPDVDNNPDRPDAGKYSSGSSKPVKRVTPIATPSINEEDITVVKKGSGIKKKISDASYGVFKSHGFVKEEEQLDEISSELKASYVSGAKKQIKQSEPFTKKGQEYRDIAKNFIAKRQRGIAKASKVEEAVRIGGIGSGNSSRRSYGPSSHGMDSAEGDTLENIPHTPKTDKEKRIKAALDAFGDKMKAQNPKLREDSDPCWKGYKMVGMKDKNGRKVPNCVPGEGVPAMKKEAVEDDPKADQMTTDDNKFPKKSRKAAIVKAAAKKMPAEDQFQPKPVLDSQVAQQTNK